MTAPKRARIPKTPPKPKIEREAFYTVAELNTITGIGLNTIYAIVRPRDGRPRQRRYIVTGAEFLALRAAYTGYADVA